MNDDFMKYRLRKGYAESTIKIQDSYLRRFFGWLILNQRAVETINYQTIINYLSGERKKHIKPVELYKRLQAVRIYLDYEMENGILQDNPANRIKLKDKEEKVLLPPINKTELDRIYNEFAGKQIKTERAKRTYERDTIILGLLIFQGLDSGNLKRLTVKDINLTAGTIYIASNRKSNARTLKLESVQILSIHNYITQTRETIRQNRTGEKYLFTTGKLDERVSVFFRKLKTQYPEIQSPGHIRQSVIIQWMKAHPIRQVQYMAGHKNIRSTERYRDEDINDLTQQILKFHPVK
jgi:integrase/recombinase XerD